MGYVDIRLTKEEAEKVRELLSSSSDVDMLMLHHAIGVQLDQLWDKDHDQGAPCFCGHTYYRHFDSYEDMEPVGCKYCECYTFKE